MAEQSARRHLSRRIREARRGATKVIESGSLELNPGFRRFSLVISHVEAHPRLLRDICCMFPGREVELRSLGFSRARFPYSRGGFSYFDGSLDSMATSTRRRFVSWCAASVAAFGLVGCGAGEQKQEGTTAENPPDIQESLERSSAGYEAEGKSKKKK